MQAIGFSEICSRLDVWRFPPGIDGVVGIATGGVVPAALVARKLGVELKTLAVNFREPGNNSPQRPMPELLSAPPDLGAWQRILLVDDVWVSGASWRVARSVLPARVEVLPFVIKGQVDFALFSDRPGCVQWPWQPI